MQLTNVIVLCALLPALGLAAPAPAPALKDAIKAAAGGGGAGGAKAAAASSTTSAGTGASTGRAGNNASNGNNATNGNNNASNGNNNASNGNASSSSSTSSAARATGSVSPVINPKFNGGNPPIDVTIAKESVPQAVNGWQADTGIVSTWLNTATSLQGDAFTQGATVAYNAEVNELNHKAVLDKNLPQSAIAGANDTLATQGAFQAVVDSLQAMISEGPGTAQARVDEINNNRCVNVLPNINSYFSVAGSPQSTASVPTGCSNVAATNTGSVVPTEAAGNNGNNAPNNNAQAGSSTTSSPASAATGNNNNNNNQNGNNGNGNGNNAKGGNNNAAAAGASTSPTTSRQGANAKAAKPTGKN